ncbi:ubiquitin-like 1-activating enzyme E1 B [Pancytospora philotis]|nr:ubiquitin-like 1-activating enzyme E1 B [Pancytospora philotis]
MTTKILVVGAGGLGCELLKMLADDMEASITVIDLDTIDRTNLNRQFLFDAESVGMSKAQVVADKLTRLRMSRAGGDNDALRIKPIFGNVKDYKRVDFYSQFDIVYNCLDSDEVRSFVNARCSLGGVPMVDGGSGGWLGQSFCNKMECFDCLPKKGGNEIPVCTIRGIPAKFEHCLAWGKAIVEDKNIEALTADYAAYAANSGSDSPVPTAAEKEPSHSQDAESSTERREINGLGLAAQSNPEAADSQYVAKKCKLAELRCDSSSEEVQEASSTRDGNSTTSSHSVRFQAILECSSSTDEELMPSNSDSEVEIAESGPGASTAAAPELPARHEAALCPSSPDESLESFVDAVNGCTAESELALIYRLALWKASKFTIQPLSFFDSQTYVRRIVPSFCTTNAIIASLMILSARNWQNYFLVQGELKLLQIDLKAPSDACLTCSVPTYTCKFGSGCRVRDFLKRFGAFSFVTSSDMYYSHDADLLKTLDGEFGMVSRDEKAHRVYFELSGECADSLLLDIQRVR